MDEEATSTMLCNKNRRPIMLEVVLNLRTYDERAVHVLTLTLPCEYPMMSFINIPCHLRHRNILCGVSKRFKSFMS